MSDQFSFGDLLYASATNTLAMFIAPSKRSDFINLSIVVILSDEDPDLGIRYEPGQIIDGVQWGRYDEA